MTSKARGLANLGNAFDDGALSNRNKVINGAMVIDQRNAGAAVTPTDAYVLDRWEVREDTDGAVTAQQVSDAPSGFSFSQRITTTTADASLATIQRLLVSQPIEGFNTADLAFGSASASSVTISFWVKSSLTGTFAGCLQNSARNRSYVFNYTINAADTWEQKSVTVVGDTTGTWVGATNGTGLRLIFALGVGPDNTGTANSWQSSTLFSSSGAVSVIGTLDATWYITGVQLEAGDTATPFEHRSYGQELALCQRYFCKTYNYVTVPGTATTTGNLFNSIDGTQSFAYTAQFNYPVSMRASSTITVYNPNTGVSGQIAGDANTYDAVVADPSSERCAIGVSNISINQSTYMRAHATADAEL